MRHLVTGAFLGLVIGFVAKELDLTTVVSYHGDRTLVVSFCLVAGALLSLTSWRILVSVGAATSFALWLLVAFTPLTSWMGEALVRRDPLVKADAIFVLSSGLQPDGELSSVAMSRLLRGLELLGEGWAPRLVLSELPEPWPRYRVAACELMEAFGLSNEVLVVGPVLNTHDEAVAVGALVRDYGFDKLLVVTSPSHSRRAAAALEAEGVHVVSVPSTETKFDYENLGLIARGDDRIDAFGVFLHEYVGLWYYGLRGWLLR